MRFFNGTIWKSHKRTLLAIAFVFLYSASVSLATPPSTKYQPGQTLNPNCAPGDSNCSVQILPEQAGNADRFLTTDGNQTAWSASTLMLGGNFTTGHAVTLNTSGVTNLTLPTSGTLVNSATTQGMIDTSVNASVSGTANYVPKFTGANSIGNSIIYDDGVNVGIGDVTPSSRLEVNGDIRLTAGSGAQIVFADGSTMSSAGAGSAASVAANGDAIVTGDGDANNSGDVILKTASNDRLHILNNGNVGVGDATPASLFTVGNGDLFQVSSGGVVVAGAWNGSVVAGQYGGTGVANTGKTITVSGNTTIGSSTHTVTFATSNNTSVTLPTSGTLATLAGSETLTNKTLTTPVINGTITGTTVIPIANGGTGSATQNFVDLSNTQTIGGQKTFTGYVYANAAGPAIRAAGQTTGSQYFDISTSNAHILMGAESSTGGSIVTGSLANSAVVGTLNNKPLQLFTNNAIRMTIEGGGNVGIGTASPAAKLDVASNTDTQVLLGRLAVSSTFSGYATISQYDNRASTTNYMLAGSSGGDTTLNSPTGADLKLAIGGSSLLTIKSGGNVGIGTTSPIYPHSGVTTVAPLLQIQSSSSNTPALVLSSASAANSTYVGNIAFATTGTSAVDKRVATITAGTTADSTTVPTGELTFWTNNAGSLTQKMVIDKAGNVGIGTTAPTQVLQVGGNSGVMALGDGLTANGTSRILFTNSNSVTNWRVSTNDTVSAAFEIAPSTIAGGKTFTTPAFIITGAGNVGIGTTGPAAKLDVEAAFTNVATNDIAYFSRLGGAVRGSIGYSDISGAIYIGTKTDHPFEIRQGNDPTISIATNQVVTFANSVGATGFNSSSGYMNFNTGEGFQVGRDGAGGGGFYVYNLTDARYDLRISEAGGAATFASNVSAASFGGGQFNVNYGGTFRMYDDNQANYWDIRTLSPYSSHLHFIFNGTDKAEINKSTGAYTALSDVNKKKNFEAYTGGLANIRELKPTLYNMKDQADGTPKELGFIAQEVRDVVPQAYTENGDFIGLNYSAFTPVIVNAIKELDIKVQVIPDFDDPTLYAKVTDFLRGIAERGEAVIDLVTTKKVETDELCIKRTDGSSVCVNADQLDSMLGGGNSSGGNSGSEDETVPPPDEEVAGDGDTPPADEEATPPEEEPETPGEDEAIPPPEETPEPETGPTPEPPAPDPAP